MKELSKQFWKETSKLIDAHRKNDDERAAQGVVDSRIVFNRLVKKLTLTDVVSCVCKTPEPRLKVSENGTHAYCSNCAKTYLQK